MDNQFSQTPAEQLTANHPSHFCATNIISDWEPNHKKFNYFDLHAHQLIEPLDILPPPAH